MLNLQDALNMRWEYTGPQAVCRNGSPAQGQSQGYTNAGEELGMANKTLGQANDTINANPQNSPFYKSLLTAGTTATTNAYKNAQSNLLAKSNAAGFGYSQPITTGAGAELGGEEASALGALPAKATQQAEQTQLEQAGLENQQAGVEAGAGENYFDTASSAEQQGLNRNSAFWNNLVSAGLGAAGKLIKPV